MRWKGFFILLILLVVVVGGWMLFKNRWIESGLEKAGQAVVGARVEIDDLDFSLLGLSLAWDHLQVADPNRPMRNLVETGPVAFNLEGAALLRKRFIGEEMVLEDFRSGTARATDGTLPKREKRKKSSEPGVVEKVKAKLVGEMEKLPVMTFDVDALKRKIDVDSLVVPAELKTPGRVDSARTNLLRTAEAWEAFYRDFHPEEELRRIRTDLERIDVKSIKTLPEVLSTLERLRETQRTFIAMSDTIDDRYRQARRDVARLEGYSRDAGRWVEEDYQRVLGKARLPDLSTKQMGKILFGPTLVNRVVTVLDYVQVIRGAIPKKRVEPKKTAPPRMKGRTVAFEDRHGWPTFLIREIRISGQTGAGEASSGFFLRGRAEGVTSQPWIYGKPTLVDLFGEKAGRTAALDAVLDHTTEAARDSFAMRFEGIPLGDVTLSGSRYLPSRLSGGRANFAVAARIRDDDFFLRADVRAQGVAWDFSTIPSDDGFVQIVREVLSGVTTLTLNAEVFGRGDEVIFRMGSNVDELVSGRLRRVASEALRDAQTRIRSRIEGLTEAKVAELNRVVGEKTGLIGGPVELQKQESDTIRSLMERKLSEITEDVGNRQKEGLEKKTKKLLEDLLR